MRMMCPPAYVKPFVSPRARSRGPCTSSFLKTSPPQRRMRRSCTPESAAPPAANRATIERAAERIRAAERPLLLIASGANRAEAQDSVRALVESSGLYFFTTQMGKGVVDDAHPQCLGTATLSSGDWVHRAVEAADLIINLGHDLCEKPPFVMKPGGAEVIHVAFEPAQMDPVYFPQHEIVGCLPANARALAEVLEGSAAARVKEAPPAFAMARSAYTERILEQDGADLGAAHPRSIVAAVRAALPPEAVVSLDNGMYKLWFSRYFRTERPHTLLLDNALATMGAGLPVAIGAKRAVPGAPVIAVCGDGGFAMNSAELETAVRLELDLVVLLLRDGALGMIRWKQADHDFPSYGLTFGNPDFVKLAEAYGATGHRVTEREGLEAILRRAVAAGGVHLIDAPIDYSFNEAEFG